MVNSDYIYVMEVMSTYGFLERCLAVMRIIGREDILTERSIDMIIDPI